MIFSAAGRTRGEAGGCPIKVLRRVLVFVLIVVALYFLLPRLVGVEKAGELISQANWALLVFAVVIEGVALTGYANLFRFILHVLDIRLSLGRRWSRSSSPAWPRATSSRPAARPAGS